jgi:hypothetical protein
MPGCHTWLSECPSSSVAPRCCRTAWRHAAARSIQWRSAQPDRISVAALGPAGCARAALAGGRWESRGEPHSGGGGSGRAELGGNWYSLLREGQCRPGRRPGPRAAGGCAWRAVAVPRVVNASCVMGRLAAAAQANLDEARTVIPPHPALFYIWNPYE